MLETFVRFVKEKELFAREDTVLLAVSGGVDSVVMAHLFAMAGYRFSLAHCNFQLRGKDSDDDAAFVADLAAQLKVPFHCNRFETTQKAQQDGISIQMAARQLRYEWFEKLRGDTRHHYIATAHHLDDNTETLLLNITRGTGLRGLEGIPVKNGQVLRPLLFASRNDIEQFAMQHKLTYRTDLSNLEDKYARNKIRLHVLPHLRQLNPTLDQSVAKLSQIAHQSRLLVGKLLEDFVMEHCKYLPEGNFSIDIEALLELPAPGFVLYELLHPMGFEPAVCEDIGRHLQGSQPGKLFYSPTHSCLRDRNKLLISPANAIKHARVEIKENTLHVNFSGGELHLEKITHEQMPPFEQIPPFISFLDYDRLDFPLVLRNPNTGDTFAPLGMKGRKKISDFLTDRKIPRTQKAKVWLLCSEENIAWVVGMRADERFKVKKSSKNILKVKFVPHSEGLF